LPAYEALCKEAETDYEGYWARLAREFISWKTPFTKVLDESNAPFFKWFEDGTLNASYNCLDRNMERGLGDKTALIFEADGGEVTKVSYSQLLARPARFANGLRSLGVGKGDRVIIYISMSVDGVAAMQACARIGATHSVVFGGFSAKALRDRIEDTGAESRHHRRPPDARRQAIAAQVDRGRGDGPGRLRFRQKRSGRQAHGFRGRNDRWPRPTGWPMCWLARRAPVSQNVVEAEHPLFLLYTSGSTGKPKGVQHSTGGYLLHAALTTNWTFDLKPDRRLLVHRRHRLGHRPHLYHLWPTGSGWHRDRVRRACPPTRMPAASGR
jgi:acetyl-CoA synthetase